MCDYEATLELLEKDIALIEQAFKRLRAYSNSLRQEMQKNEEKCKKREEVQKTDSQDSNTDKESEISEPEILRAPEEIPVKKRVTFKEPKRNSDERKFYDPFMYSPDGIYSRRER